AANCTLGSHPTPETSALRIAQRFHRDWASRNEKDAKTIATSWVVGATFVDQLDLRRDPFPTQCDTRIAEGDVSPKPVVFVCEPARIPGYYVTAYDVQQKAEGEFLVVNVEFDVRCPGPLVGGICPNAQEDG